MNEESKHTPKTQPNSEELQRQGNPEFTATLQRKPGLMFFCKGHFTSQELLASYRMVAANLRVQKAFLELKIAQNRIRRIAGLGNSPTKGTFEVSDIHGDWKRGAKKGGLIGQETSSLQPLPESPRVCGFCPHLHPLHSDGRVE